MNPKVAGLFLLVGFRMAAAGNECIDDGASLETFAAQVSNFRTAVVYRAEDALQTMTLIAGTGQLVAGVEDRAKATIAGMIWGPFFENAIVIACLGRGGASAMFYNPLLDIAVVTRWQGDRTLRIVGIRAIAGERLVHGNAQVDIGPPWLSADSPIDAIQDYTAARVEAFIAHPEFSVPPLSESPADNSAAALEFMLVQPRLAWNAQEYHNRSKDSASSASRWLVPTLARVREAMVSADVVEIQAAAPSTDRATADLLAGLDAAYSRALVLDMVLEQPDGFRTLIGSAVADGNIYVFADCVAESDDCRLETFSVVALERPASTVAAFPGVWAAGRK